MAEKTMQTEREKQLTREELDNLLEELGVSTETARDEYRSRVESFNKLTLWQDQRNTQIAQLSAT
ncbi:MAG: hypothetical protein CML02_08905 [Pseudooceanicola sp.]|jgi:arsenate reductase-like glutaredoxin family protein|nr:hypothetical protein [Pseudooceanicola sp.]|tara:strand:+ start:2074 stop:2268 length:195 start_codon:yes stop_codon:yes gene_type:complete